MSWLSLVEDAGVDEESFGKMTAADQLRMALHVAGIPRDIPDVLAELKAAANKVSVSLDGPGAVTALRNDVVHPKAKRRLEGVQVGLQGSLLGTRMLELLLLRRLGYQGVTVDRLTGESAVVPWAQPTR
jgi:hypothetical protein